MKEIVMVSGNKGKIKEAQEILKEFKIILDDIILVSSKENKDIFDYDEEL